MAIVAACSAAATSLHTSHAFIVLPSSCVTKQSNNNALPLSYSSSINTVKSTSTTLLMSSTPSSSTSNTLKLELEKPLGLILEEADDNNNSSGGAGGGVIITQINEGGSAYNSPYYSANNKLLINAKIIMVMDTNVSNMSFEDVMDVIVGAPSPLSLELELADGVVTTEDEDSASESAEATESTAAVVEYEIGTTVTIQVEQPDNKPTITLDATVGDNLRKTLLANKDIELYRGLKKKLGNCGGGGQCGFCAVELKDDSEGGGVWGERSEYEDRMIGKKAGTEGYRLACMNNVVGPATVKTL